MYSVVGVQTQGNGQCEEWTTELEVHTSIDGAVFAPATRADGDGTRFPGNCDQHSIVTNHFAAPTNARYVRFVVKSWGDRAEPCFRAEVLIAVGDDCVETQLLEALCASSATIKSAVMSAETLAAMATPSTMGVALK